MVKRIQHAWLRYAYDPETRVGKARMESMLHEANQLVHDANVRESKLVINI